MGATRVTEGNIPSLLIPGVVKSFFGKYTPRYKAIYPELVEQVNTTKPQEKFVGIVDIGMPRRKYESTSISYDSFGEFADKFINIEGWGLGFNISQDMIDDNQYADVALKDTRNLKDRFEQLREYQTALVFDRAFSSSYTGYDGVSLVNASHVLGNNGTFSNVLTTAQDLSQLAVQQLITQIRGTIGEEGLPEHREPMRLVIAIGNEHVADEILETKYQTNTANNNVNTIEYNKKIPGGKIMNPYLQAQDAWFITTDCPEGIMMVNRLAPRFNTAYDEDALSWKVNAYMRFKVDFVRYKAVFGSPGG